MATTLYRAYRRNGQLLYVGITDDVDARLRAHRYSADWYPIAERWTFEEHPDRDTAALAEVEAIREERPEFNIKDAPNAQLRIKFPVERRPDVISAEREAELDAAAEAVAATAPPFTAEQMDRLRVLLALPMLGGDA